MLALYDLFAVLTPCGLREIVYQNYYYLIIFISSLHSFSSFQGPLKALVGLMQEYEVR